MTKPTTISVTGYTIILCQRCKHLRFCIQLIINNIIENIYICSDCLHALAITLDNKEREAYFTQSESDEE